MLTKILKAHFSFFATKQKPINLKQQHINLTNQIRNQLTQLFTERKNIILLSKTFRIFPSYFAQKLINKMLNSQYINEYIEYILVHKNLNQQKDQQLQKLLKKLNMDRNIQCRMLEIYINFIKRTIDLTENQILMEIFDIRNPQNWFNSKLVGQRKFIYHHGPTNSGKTFSAINQLKNLKENQKGIYMAPLRLLAWQTQQKLGKCNLITGQEKDFKNSHLTSCTIQAAKIDQYFDVAVIDQIQMIGDQSRGWSWTSSVLGLKAEKIHLCGDERALNLISQLIKISGGTLQEKKYTRLSKLHLIKKSFSLSDLKPGDCLIDFASQKLYSYRNQINKLKGTPQKPSTTAIIYGKMPPKCRQAQAQKFNSGQLPYLVASDAIGMGLNLNIRRIIFLNLTKMNHDKKQKVLEDHQIRQIAGRAGRGYGHGYVQCKNADMREKVKYALRSVNLSIQQNQPQDLQLRKQQEPNKMSDLGNPSIQKLTPEEANTTQQGILISEGISQYYDESLKRYLKEDELKVNKAGIFFPVIIMQRIKIKMQRILGRTLKISETADLISKLSKQNKDLYFIEKNSQLFTLSDHLEHLQLPFHIHFTFSKVPIPNLNKKVIAKVITYATQFKYKGIVNIPQEIIASYNDNFSECKTIQDIPILQQHFVLLQSYTWLWNHFQLYFPYNNQVNKIKQAICDKMTQMLDQTSNNEIKNKKENNNNKKTEKLRKKIQKQQKKNKEKQEQKLNQLNLI